MFGHQWERVTGTVAETWRDQGADAPAIRASDRDREAVTAQLQDAFAQGRLRPQELDERVQAALSARTMADLYQLTADLLPARRDLRSAPAYVYVVDIGGPHAATRVTITVPAGRTSHQPGETVRVLVNRKTGEARFDPDAPGGQLAAPPVVVSAPQRGVPLDALAAIADMQQFAQQTRDQLAAERPPMHPAHLIGHADIIDSWLTIQIGGPQIRLSGLAVGQGAAVKPGPVTGGPGATPGSPPGRPPARPTAEQRLAQLRQLLYQGALSASEFEAKKKQLIDEI